MGPNAVKSGGEQQPSGLYAQWANIGEKGAGDDAVEYIKADTQEEYVEKVRGANHETAMDVAAELGVAPGIISNPEGAFVTENELGLIEYIAEGRNFVTKDETGIRALNRSEKDAAIEHIKSSRFLTPEDAKMVEMREIGNRGNEKRVEGFVVEDDGAVRISSYLFVPRDNFGISFGSERVMRAKEDGGLTVESVHYSGSMDGFGGFYASIKGQEEYSADGVLLKQESVFLDADGSVRERIITERDPDNPFLSKCVKYEGDSEEPASEQYGIIDLSDVGSIGYLQKKEDADPRLDTSMFGRPEALAFDTREQAASYLSGHFGQRLAEGDYSARTHGRFHEDARLNGAVKAGVAKMAAKQ